MATLSTNDSISKTRNDVRLQTLLDGEVVSHFRLREFENREGVAMVHPAMLEALERVRQSFASSEPGKDKLLQAIEALKHEVRGAEPPAADLPVRASAPARLTAKRGSKILVLSPAEVMWFEADETLVFARAGSGRFLVERTLTDLETLMGPTFFRSHRRYLVNLAFIREILPGDAGTYEVVMKNEDKSRVPLSRRQARKLKELIPW